MSVDLESLSDVLKHPIRRRIIFVLYERGRLSYVDLMNLVEVDSTGKFNYHLKILGDLIEKGRNGKYGLTEKGRMIAQLLQKFPEKKVEGKDKLLKIGYNLSISAGMLIIVTEIIRLVIFQFYNPSCVCLPFLSRVNLRAGNQILALTAFIFGPIQIICGILTKRKLYIILPLMLLSSLLLVFYGYSLGLTIGYWTVGTFTGLWIPSITGILIQIVFTTPFLVAGIGGSIIILWALAKQGGETNNLSGKSASSFTKLFLWP